MKKNFFTKKLASGLALALVVASLSPAGVSAATATKIVKQDKSKAPNVLYVGDKGTDYSLSNTYKTNTYSWKISNSKIATINAKTGVVTPKAPGTVTIKVTARKASTNKWLKDFTMKIYVKLRADSVEIGAEDFTLGVSETKDLNAVKTPAKSTDTIVYASSDEKVAKVDAKTGVVTGVASGKATITVYSKGTSKSAITSKYNRTDSVEVTVGNAITKFEATTPKKLAVTFAEALTATYTKDNFTVLTADTATKNYIKAITTSADKKTVTIEFYSELTSGKSYDLTATFGSDVYKATTPFVKGAVAKIVGTNQVVKADATGTNAQAIAYTVYDENGLDITDSTVVTFESNVGVTADGKISLGNGVLAYVTVVYTNPTTGNQIKSETFTVTGSDAVATASAGFTLSSSAVTSWPSTTTSTLAYGSTKYVYVKTTDQYGVATIYGNGATNGATFESLDPSVFVIDATSGLITPVAVGSGQFKVTIGSVTQIYSVTVTAAAAAKSLAVDSATVNKASLTLPTVNHANINVNVLDQNSKEFTAADSANSTALTATLLSATGSVSLTSTGSAIAVNDVIPFTSGSDLAIYGKSAGTAVFKVASANTSLAYVIVVVTVYNADPVIVGYGIDGVKNLDVNAAYDSDASTSPVANLTVGAVNAGGFVVDVLTNADTSIKLVNPNNVATTVTGGALTIDVTGNASVAGTYYVYAIVNGATIASSTFTVVDTDTQPNVYLTSNSVSRGTAASNLASIFNLDGATFVGITFTTGNSAAITSPAAGAYLNALTVGGTTDVYLYNVAVKVTKDGRDFVIKTNTNLKVTN